MAILVIPALDVAARFLAEPGWIFAFVIMLGSPIWLIGYFMLARMAIGMLSPNGVFAKATKAAQVSVRILLWVFLLSVTMFCWFVPDGGDTDDWQSPAGRLLGVDEYNSDTPEYLNHAQTIGWLAFPVGVAALTTAGIVYANAVSSAGRKGGTTYKPSDSG
ncbi:hypothetical protein OHA40_01080 [Nocardia sp. NBC_00508]|uniref:hypothetical protein n=1 Tax=Nocardia sp. NBC_00508 TaxID=2975992 RepID=UPI002E8181A8|nr:hypothetical protein [Nocardia sp. NBC_00508]WUD66796.1 hypothetical protein OHA40_01080 [Nocardia sp. NBC_00508]